MNLQQFMHKMDAATADIREFDNTGDVETFLADNDFETLSHYIQFEWSRTLRIMHENASITWGIYALFKQACYIFNKLEYAGDIEKIADMHTLKQDTKFKNVIEGTVFSIGAVVARQTPLLEGFLYNLGAYANSEVDLNKGAAHVLLTLNDEDQDFHHKIVDLLHEDGESNPFYDWVKSRIGPSAFSGIRREILRGSPHHLELLTIWYYSYILKPDVRDRVKDGFIMDGLRILTEPSRPDSLEAIFSLGQNCAYEGLPDNFKCPQVGELKGVELTDEQRDEAYEHFRVLDRHDPGADPFEVYSFYMDLVGKELKLRSVDEREDIELINIGDDRMVGPLVQLQSRHFRSGIQNTFQPQLANNAEESIRNIAQRMEGLRRHMADLPQRIREDAEARVQNVLNRKLRGLTGQLDEKIARKVKEELHYQLSKIQRKGRFEVIVGPSDYTLISKERIFLEDEEGTEHDFSHLCLKISSPDRIDNLFFLGGMAEYMQHETSEQEVDHAYHPHISGHGTDFICWGNMHEAALSSMTGKFTEIFKNGHGNTNRTSIQNVDQATISKMIADSLIGDKTDEQIDEELDSIADRLKWCFIINDLYKYVHAILTVAKDYNEDDPYYRLGEPCDDHISIIDDYGYEAPYTSYASIREWDVRRLMESDIWPKLGSDLRADMCDWTGIEDRLLTEDSDEECAE